MDGYIFIYINLWHNNVSVRTQQESLTLPYWERSRWQEVSQVCPTVPARTKGISEPTPAFGAQAPVLAWGPQCALRNLVWPPQGVPRCWKRAILKTGLCQQERRAQRGRRWRRKQGKQCEAVSYLRRAWCQSGWGMRGSCGSQKKGKVAWTLLGHLGWLGQPPQPHAQCPQGPPSPRSLGP